MKGRMTTGAPREGAALLAGLLRCGQCGRRFSVHYSGKYGAALYRCRGAKQREPIVTVDGLTLRRALNRAREVVSGSLA